MRVDDVLRRPRRPRRRQRPLRVLLGAAHRLGADQAQQPHRRAARAPGRGAPQWWDDCLLENYAFGAVCRLGRLRPAVDPEAGQGAAVVGHGRPTSTRATGSSPARASCGSTRWSTPSRARRAPRRSTGSGSSSTTSGCCSASRSRCASPPPTTSRCRPASGRPVVLHRHPRVRGHGVPALLRGCRAHHGRLRRPAPLGQAPLPDGRDAGAPLPRVGSLPGRAATGSTPSGASPTTTPARCWAHDHRRDP